MSSDFCLNSKACRPSAGFDFLIVFSELIQTSNFEPTTCEPVCERTRNVKLDPGEIYAATGSTVDLMSVAKRMVQHGAEGRAFFSDSHKIGGIKSLLPSGIDDDMEDDEESDQEEKGEGSTWSLDGVL
jgi:hypothetical protein